LEISHWDALIENTKRTTQAESSEVCLTPLKII
jgi:hypothetical protein